VKAQETFLGSFLSIDHAHLDNAMPHEPPHGGRGFGRGMFPPPSVATTASRGLAIPQRRTAACADHVPKGVSRANDDA